MYNKNLILLIIAQIFGFTAAPVTIFLSGIIGSTLTSLTTLSTLPTASIGFMLTLVGWEIMNILCVPLSLLVIFMTLRADISEKKSAQIIMNKG